MPHACCRITRLETECHSNAVPQINFPLTTNNKLVEFKEPPPVITYTCWKLRKVNIIGVTIRDGLLIAVAIVLRTKFLGGRLPGRPYTIYSNY